MAIRIRRQGFLAMHGVAPVKQPLALRARRAIIQYRGAAAKKKHSRRQQEINDAIPGLAHKSR
jgi:hypothetical protein